MIVSHLRPDRSPGSCLGDVDGSPNHITLVIAGW